VPAAVEAQVREALQRVPEADRRILVDRGIDIELVPDEVLPDGNIGATTIVSDAGDGGPWRPTAVRIAALGTAPGEQPADIALHEIGHVVSVVRHQDRSEAAAEDYALRYGPGRAAVEGAGQGAGLVEDSGRSAGFAVGGVALALIALALLL